MFVGPGLHHWMDVARLGLTGRVVDFGFFFFSDVFAENKAQIQRVEQLSNAYHVSLAGEDVMVAYLVEITRGRKATATDSDGLRRRVDTRRSL